MTTPAATRLYGIVAARARVAVIFRRGPAKQVRMLRWDLRTDTVTGGQWLSGRLFPERGDLSADGELVVYFAVKQNTKLGTFTAVSRPPYFTALALWPEGSTWGGGGTFVGSRRLMLHYGMVLPELNGGAGLPPGFEVICERDLPQRPEPHGWTTVQQGRDVAPPPGSKLYSAYDPPWLFHKPSPADERLRLERRWIGSFEQNGPRTVESFGLLRATAAQPRGQLTEELGRLDWADWDHDGSLLIAREGCLWRRRAPQARAASDELVADLRDQRFERIVPPAWARRWP